VRPTFRAAPVIVAILSSLLAADGAGAFPSHSGGTGLFDVQTAHVPVSGSSSLGFSGVAYRVMDLEIVPASDRDVVDWGVRGSLALWDRIEVWGRWNEAWIRVDGESEMSHRDGLLGAKLALPSKWPWMETALASSLNLPWADRERGFSTGAIDPSVSGLLTFHLPESNAATYSSLHVNLGYHFHGDSRGRAFEGNPLYYLEPVYPEGDNDRIDLRAAIEFGSEKMTIFAELLLDQLYESDEIKFQESPIFLTPGFRYSITESFSFMLASKVAISSDHESTTKFLPPEQIYPDWQLGFSFAWSRFGPAVDRDDDGVPDIRDRCPRDAEDVDGWDDQDGCPDADNDGDGIRDEIDAVPNEPEDRDGYLDSDGAPDPDNDGDGIPDDEDACPDEAEDLDGVADGDGCPETDADGDGVPDTHDACPERPAPEGGLHGCPEEAEFEAPFEFPGIEWSGADVPARPGSFAGLAAIATRLARSPRLALEIRVYPPATGEGAGDLELAGQRADFLKTFLVQAGVPSGRVVASGLERRPNLDGDPGTRVFLVPSEAAPQ
jgi:hypothetical protein